MSIYLILSLCGFAFMAGFVDAVVGGGGLIQLPALLVLGVGWPHTVALGTNKFASIAGTFVALLRYLRTVPVDRKVAIPSAVTAMLCSGFGAWVVSHMSSDFFRPLVIVLLVGVAVYTWRRKELGGDHRPKYSGQFELGVALGIAAVLGFYDGFFGPGTGTFLVFLYIGLLGYGFLNASTYAKVVNLATNLGALVYFVWTGNVYFEAALPMAAAQIAGGYIGASTAIKKGAPFVRMLFLSIVSLLIIKLLWQVIQP